jgi:small subunit ribosomal protein S17
VRKEKNKLERGNRKTKTGVVVANKMLKTVVVEVSRTLRHPFYGKVIRTSQKFKSHDEDNKCTVGDLVEIVETRPISKDKRWRVTRVLGKGKISLHELPKKRKAKEETVASLPDNEIARLPDGQVGSIGTETFSLGHKTEELT